MPSTTEILSALQYDVFYEKGPVNEADAPSFRITYQFAGTSQPDDMPVNGSYIGWEAWNEADKARFREALDHIETFLNIDFVEVTGAADPDLNVGRVYLPGNVIGNGGYSVSYTGDQITDWDGFVTFDRDYDIINGDLGVILHELGHALGLRHSHDTDTFSSEVACTVCGQNHPEGYVEPDNIAYTFENTKYTVMSYDENPDTLTVGDEMMLFDVIALQDIWGATDFNMGNSIYRGPAVDTVDLIWDTGGIDILDASWSTHSVRLDLRQGAFSRFGDHDDVVIADGVVIECATGGAYDDWISGSGARNILKGGSGADRVFGRAGDDRLSGQKGDDALRGNGGDDRLIGNLGEDRLAGHRGNDVLRGGADDDRLIGGAGSDLLLGGAGNDLLKGGAGNDRLNGGRGVDALHGGTGADVFVFKAGFGSDQIADFGDGADRLLVQGLGSSADIMAAAFQLGADVVLNFGDGDVLSIIDVSLADVENALI